MEAMVLKRRGVSRRKIAERLGIVRRRTMAWYLA